MTVICPKCGTKLNAGSMAAGALECPSCGESIDMDSLRSANCPICCSPFAEKDEVCICPNCKTPHHAECWENNRGCSTYGCDSAHHEETHLENASNAADLAPGPMYGSDKISISLDEVNSERVDAEIHRQDIAARMAAHQEQVEANTPPARRFGGGFFRKAVVYMAVFGFIASVVGWGAGEIVQNKQKHHVWYQWNQCQFALNVFKENHPYGDYDDWLDAVDNLRNSGHEEFRSNPFFKHSFWTQSTWKLKQEIDRANASHRSYRRLDNWWFVWVGLFVGLGLALAEPIVGHNWKSALLRGILGSILGALGGFVVSLFINEIYRFLGGGKDDSSFAQQMFARGVGWSILGAFLAIAPGIAMRNWKKLLLGLAGGAIGGLVGGMLFDPICKLTGSDIPARFVNIVGLGVGAAVATTLLEEAAKQGWLKVATGVITGKQFILYRNPTVIGSSPKSEIYLFKDPTVAPKHAAINRVGGEFLVTALNGATVLLNGTPARQQRLRNGDQIRVGNTVFLFGARAVKRK